MLSLVIDFGLGIGIATTLGDAQQKITDESVRSGNRGAWYSATTGRSAPAR
jgi:hypothetical protein